MLVHLFGLCHNSCTKAGMTALWVSWWELLLSDLWLLYFCYCLKTPLKHSDTTIWDNLWLVRIRDRDLSYKSNPFEPSNGYFWNLFCRESPVGLYWPSVSSAIIPWTTHPWTGISSLFFQYSHNPVKISSKNILHDSKHFFQTPVSKGKTTLNINAWNARVSYLNFIHGR